MDELWESIFAVNGNSLAPRLRRSLDILYFTLSSTYKDLQQLFLQIQLLDNIAAFFCDCECFCLRAR